MTTLTNDEVGRPGTVRGDVRGPALPSIDDLFRRYSVDVAALGRAVLGRGDETEDMVQDVFMVAFRALKGVKHPELVKSWLMTIAIRVARKSLQRRNLRWTRLTFDETAVEEVAAPGVPPEDRLLFRRLFRVLDTLPVKLRLAWVLHYLQAESAESVAELCGCSRSTAKRRITAAQERVLQQMT